MSHVLSSGGTTSSTTMPVPQKIVTELHHRITTGLLLPGDRLPSTRALAHELGVSRGSVVAAYEQLQGEGYLVATHGGTRVDPQLPTPPRGTTSRPDPQAEHEPTLALRPGVPDTTELTSAQWRAAWRAAAANPRPHPPEGSLELRRLLAEHVRGSRRLEVDPQRILLTAGARDGLRLVLSALGAPGMIGVEDPGYPSLREVPRLLGWHTVPLAMDDDGVLPSALSAVQAAVVTPNHQFPRGTRMPALRRLELLAAAGTEGTVLIEDDFDAELHQAPPPLLALVPSSRTVLLGSFSKSLSPALGLGWVVLPEDMVHTVARRCVPVSGIVQDAMTRFLEQDGLRRHTARARRLDRRRRAVFHEVFPLGQPMEGGLHAVLYLSPGADETRIVTSARQAGLAVQALGSYWSAAAVAQPGIVLGLGVRSPERLRQHLHTLRRVVAEHDPTSLIPPGQQSAQ